jgi:hypothetical protein
MTPSKPTSTGASLSGSEPTGSSTDQTPTNSVANTSSESESNQQSIQPDGLVTPQFKKMREIMIKHEVKLPFMAEFELIELIYETWNVGFNERTKLQQRWM